MAGPSVSVSRALKKLAVFGGGGSIAADGENWRALVRVRGAAVAMGGAPLDAGDSAARRLLRWGGVCAVNIGVAADI